MLRDAQVMAILPAVDIERAKTFYAEKLGLREQSVHVPSDGAAFESGDGTLLYLYEREGGTKAEHTAAGWLVEDIEAEVEELRERGIVFEQYDMPGLKTDDRGIAEAEGTRGAWFKDSEGNTLALSEMLQ